MDKDVFRFELFNLLYVYQNIQVSSKLASCNLKNDVLTIFIAECVLVYMEQKSSEVLLKWIAENFSTSLFINYEQVGLDFGNMKSGVFILCCFFVLLICIFYAQVNMTDKFAEVMLSNLVQRGCLLSGVEHCKDLATQRNR